ncbi:Response regulator receiver domain-containing protein [Halopelagius inordinatus]|uniref:Response regulator receiver domain-containing protein n=1 Tax=Halopelagius inordinatus TaxID=553467 RepID=A0A1I2MM46_9EURY|nr:response regulator [Halopelagius inordinatus]SFF91769.1 Response regulator receiver domain-containing protein [Halopelagius inordinatus]
MNGSTEPEPVDVLLVEDNPGDVRLTREAFDDGKIDNTLHVATDGVEALDFLHRRGEYSDAPRPDVVLLDLNLPRKNGDEVLAEVKDDPDLRRIPVIVLTSSESDEDILHSYEHHANAYLTKPVDPFEFMETVGTFEEMWFSIVRLPDDE